MTETKKEAGGIARPQHRLPLRRVQLSGEASARGASRVRNFGQRGNGDPNGTSPAAATPMATTTRHGTANRHGGVTPRFVGHIVSATASLRDSAATATTIGMAGTPDSPAASDSADRHDSATTARDDRDCAPGTSQQRNAPARGNGDGGDRDDGGLGAQNADHGGNADYGDRKERQCQLKQP